MIASAILFLAGIVLVQQFPALPAHQWLIVGAILAVVLIWLQYWRCLFFALGVIWAIAFASARLADRLIEPLEGIEIPVKGYIADLPKQDIKQSRFDFIVTEAPFKLPSRLRLTWYYPDQHIKAGQHWAFTVKLKRPHGTLNPGGFDYERWLFIEDVGATGYVRTNARSVLLKQDSAWVNIGVWRQAIVDRLDHVLAGNSNLGLIKALTIGDGDAINQDQWELFRKTGTTHLVVISGSHIGLIAGLVYFLILKFWAWTAILRYPPQKVAAVSAVLVAIFYSALAGFSVPTQRSVLMLLIAMFAIILQRNSRPFHTLSFALLTVLLYDPLAVLSAGFWLSFLAVAIIIYILAGRLGKPGYIWSVVKINWATSVGLSPLLLFFFQQVSLVSPLANFIAVPIISLLIVPLSLLAVVVLFLSKSLAKLLLNLVDQALQVFSWILGLLADIPLASVTHPVPSFWAILFAIPGSLLLLAPKGIPARWLGAILFMPLVFTGKQQPKTGEIVMTLLDVGQGLSAVIQTSHHAMVFDTGAKFSSDSDIGKTVLLPFLNQQGINKIDTLVISHGDNDHIGGTESLIQGIRTGKVLTSVPYQLAKHSPIVCMAGQVWVWDQVEFTVLSPPKTLFASENDNSCVLMIRSKQGSILLTGDIEAEAESWLVSHYRDKLKADVLIAPHHGSKSSSTISFLQTVQPSKILIPAGYRNQFGHPHQEVLNRYKAINTPWLNTAASGAISVNEKDGVLTVSLQREAENRYWNYR